MIEYLKETAEIVKNYLLCMIVMQNYWQVSFQMSQGIELMRLPQRHQYLKNIINYYLKNLSLIDVNGGIRMTSDNNFSIKQYIWRRKRSNSAQGFWKSNNQYLLPCVKIKPMGRTCKFCYFPVFTWNHIKN